MYLHHVVYDEVNDLGPTDYVHVISTDKNTLSAHKVYRRSILIQKCWVDIVHMTLECSCALQGVFQSSWLRL